MFLSAHLPLILVGSYVVGCFGVSVFRCSNSCVVFGVSVFRCFGVLVFQDDFPSAFRCFGAFEVDLSRCFRYFGAIGCYDFVSGIRGECRRGYSNLKKRTGEQGAWPPVVE